MDKISDLKEIVINTLDLNKAQDIVTIDLKDKSSMADYMIIASGTSSRHIQSLSEQVLEKLKNNGVKESKIEGKEIVSITEEEPEVVDIMTALKQSIEQAKADKKPMEKAGEKSKGQKKAKKAS